ncbi:MAG: hypothetical protein QOH81_623 [Sphingomonadales bacterium]|jgi:hypothetical protein|nr:hypothetical protein [Sphingomonadales bacterium]
MALAAEGVCTKDQTLRDGSRRAGALRPLVRESVYCLLENPVYSGQNATIKAVDPGRHEPLVPQPLISGLRTGQREAVVDNQIPVI